ncbi:MULTISPECIES: PPOX class F420-dependent oxidoreductase [unclassified Nocardia]|uniref:PPOX class F420-dependent oxidoreductase n=1 Tax=unclassified Nocardia TaxID=2637762 RepID=UPI001CE47E64|nr:MULTISPECIES: PPOX class F420-dependent oxidoreductase [unclassified Nocardia]
MPVVFDAEVRKILDGRNFATVATLDAHGAPHTSVVWILRDGDTVVFSTTADRLKARHLGRDPRVSLTVFDTANPYRSVDIRGVAELTDDADREVQFLVSRKYLGTEPPPEPDTVRRMVVRIVPERVSGFVGGSGRG